MATVPRLERSSGLSPLPSARVQQPAEFAGLEKTQGAAIQMYENELVRIDETRLNEERRATFDEFEYPNIYDPKTGAANLRGRDAIGIGKKLETDFDAFTAERSKGLSTERQRQTYQQFAQARKQSLIQWAARHEAAQTEAYHETEYDSGKKSSIERGSIDPANAPLEAANIKRLVMLRAQDKGLGEEFVNQELQESLTALHGGAVDTMLAEGREEDARAYYDANEMSISPAQRIKLLPKIREAGKNRVIMTKGAELWGKRVRDENDPVNIEVLTEEARKLSDDPEVVKGLITDIRERAVLHNQAIEERDDANLSAIWDAYDNRGLSKASIKAMPEYKNLSSGEKRISVMDKLDGYADKAVRLAKEQTREEKAVLQIEQEINRASLAENPALLREADLEHMVRNKELSTVGYKSLQVMKDPKKQPTARAAFKRLDDAKTKRLFNSQDANDNSKQWVEFTGMLHAFLENNPDGDPAAFVEEVMKPIELTWKEKVKDFWFGTPGTEGAVERRKQEIQAVSGQPAIQPSSYQVNKVYTDAQGRKAKYLGEGKWQTIQ